MKIQWKKALVAAGLAGFTAVPFTALADGFNFNVKVGDDNEAHYHFRDRKAHHNPQMLMAAKSLAEAKNHIWYAGRDNSGHRARAIQNIIMALDEIRAVEEMDHPGRDGRDNRDNRDNRGDR